MANFIARTHAIWDADSLVLSANQTALIWLSHSFRHLIDTSFTIGDGEPIGSDSVCVVQVLKTDSDKPPAITANGPHHYIWRIPEQEAQHYADMVDNMVKAGKPCHQYIDLPQLDSPVVFISTGEYDVTAIRDMRDSLPA
jgi:hypothetical protein